MKIKTALWMTGLWLLLCTAAVSQETGGPTASLSAGLESLLERIETRYAAPGFSANFKQTSTLKEMQITDTASGRIMVKRPGKMRWVYEQPERQTIISDGVSLWIYRPDDYQVMVGRAPLFFGEGRGAGFLSDMKMVRRKFRISQEPPADGGDAVLKLVPNQEGLDIAKIYLTVSKATSEITRILTCNAYGDETQVDLTDVEFSGSMDDALFTFNIPEGVDVLKIDE